MPVPSRLPRSAPEGVLFVRIKKVGPRDTQPMHYTVTDPEGHARVKFNFVHTGWYKVNERFGEALREKVAYQGNPDKGTPVGPPMFQVCTLDEARAVEEAERQAAERERRRKELGEAGLPDSVQVEAEDLVAEPVGKAETLDDAEEAEAPSARRTSRRRREPRQTPRGRRPAREPRGGRADDTGPSWGDDDAAPPEVPATVDRTGDDDDEPPPPKKKAPKAPKAPKKAARKRGRRRRKPAAKKG